MKSYRARVKEVQNQWVPSPEDFRGLEVIYPDGTIGPAEEMSMVIRSGQSLEDVLRESGCQLQVKIS